MSDPSSRLSVDTCQLATSVPSDRRSTIGGSAALTSQFAPEETVVGRLQPLACFSANFRVVESPLCSTQLRRTPRSESRNRGPLLWLPDGSCKGSTRTDHAGEAAFACGVPLAAASGPWYAAARHRPRTETVAMVTRIPGPRNNLVP